MVTKADLVVYFPDNVQEELFIVLDELFYFSINHYDKALLEITEGIISKMNVSEGLVDRIFPQLIWWVTFCSPMKSLNKTIYQEYLKKNKNKWNKKSPVVQQILASWLYLNPGYYYVDEDQSDSGRVFVFSDVFEGKTKIVGIYNEIFQAPKRGEMITGLLLPMGDGIYTIQGSLFHIPEHMTQKIAHKIIPYFEEYATSPNYQFNPHLYPALIKITLETMEKYL